MFEDKKSLKISVCYAATKNEKVRKQHIFRSLQKNIYLSNEYWAGDGQSQAIPLVTTESS